MGQGEKESGAMEARAKKCYFLEWGLAPYNDFSRL